MMHIPTPDQERLMQEAFDRRSVDWPASHWDYTEWEEWTDECRGICGLSGFEMIIFVPKLS